MKPLNIFFISVFAIYATLSKILFDKVYRTSNLIVDEEFHLPLGEEYCKFNFQVWDPKVTTLPGLYLISSILLGPLELCSTYWLRAVSLLFSCVNLILFYIIFSKITAGGWQKVFSALMMTLLPPLYFLAHIYYTDTVSLTTILLFIILHEKDYHYAASIVGFCSIICRQTNVVFVAIYGGKYILTELYGSWAQKSAPLRRAGRFPVKNLKAFLSDMLTKPLKSVAATTIQFWLNAACYISVLISFLIFLLINGGIVVGDRSSHQMSINVPQLFYFSLFCLVFGWPHFVGEVFNFLSFVKRHKLLILLGALLAFIAVHYNTVVHPYLLADNRHFMFYIWIRFYGKYWWFRYALIPIYMFSFYVIIKTLWDKKDVSFFILFTFGVSVLLISQSLLDLRYFFIPYIIIRFKMKNVDSAVFNVMLEFVTYVAMNLFTFNIFFTKTFYWSDSEYPQRIAW
ncbi:putative Dol-P-Glc:Glc(2)Man(9)GlcNAc(2)-PP-Dol alpha-1,2-glucosyltransferase [Dendroctonus ponderosae]